MAEIPLHALKPVADMTLAYVHDLLSATPDEELTRIPHPGMNHPAWITGHVSLSHRRVAQLLGATIEVPPEWMPLYGKGTTSQPERSLYPSRDKLISDYQAGHEALLEAILNAPADKLQSPNTFLRPDRFPNIGSMAFYALTSHVMFHMGQLSAWRRVLGHPGITI